MTTEQHYVIMDAGVTIISSDYHMAKGLGRALAYMIDRTVLIRYGQEVTTIYPSDFPLAKLFEHADS